MLDGALVPLFRPRVPEIAPPPVELIRLRIGGSALHQGGVPPLPKLYLEGADDFTRDLLLHAKHVRHVAVVVLRPEVLVGPRIDELRGDPHAPAALPNAALENVTDVELLRDLPDRLIRSFIVHRRSPRDHSELGYTRQAREDLLGEAVAEVLVVAGRAQVDERQHRDRALRSRAPKPRAPDGGDDEASYRQHDQPCPTGAPTTEPARGARGSALNAALGIALGTAVGASVITTFDERRAGGLKRLRLRLQRLIGRLR